MQKRKFIFGTYDTAAHGWTLASWTLSGAQHESNLVKVPGRSGSRDLSTVLTDGEPVYGDRTLTVTLETSEGTRLEREAVIQTMTNWLDGWNVDILMPDDQLHYVKGRLHVERLYNDNAHASVEVSAVCEPWRYNLLETVATLTATPEEQTADLINNGRLTVVPLLRITTAQDTDQVRLVFGSASWALGAGTYKLPDIVLKQGAHPLTYSGAGTVQIEYREAIL
jgi:hypothetical protein